MATAQFEVSTLYGSQFPCSFLCTDRCSVNLDLDSRYSCRVHCIPEGGVAARDHNEAPPSTKAFLKIDFHQHSASNAILILLTFSIPVEELC